MSTIDWNTYARAYNLLNNIKPYRAMHQKVASLIQHTYKNKNDRILDAGCGTGNFMTYLAKHHVPKECMVGIDASSQMRAIAQEKHGSAGAQFYEADLNTKLPFDAGTFSGIACVNALYAVQDPAFTLSEFARVLRPGGTLTIATPHDKANLGLILKEHAQSHKPNAYWERFLEGDDIARALLHEAFANDNFDHELLEIIFSTNNAITKDVRMHFMSEAELHEACRNAGLSVRSTQRTYADQDLLVCASHTRP